MPDQKDLAKMADKVFAGLKPPAQAGEKPSRFVMANGLTLIVRPRHAVPLAAFTLAAPGGQAAETDKTAGIYHLWANTITRGSKNRSYEELTTELESMAAGLSGFSGKSACGVSGSFLASDWRRGLELLSEVWLEPTFQPGQVKKAKAEQMAALRAQQDSPVSRAFLAIRPLLYGKYPYAYNPLGSAEVLAKLGQKDLLAAHQRVKGPKGAVLTVVGDMDVDEVKQEVERLFAKAQGAVTPAGYGQGHAHCLSQTGQAGGQEGQAGADRSGLSGPGRHRPRPSRHGGCSARSWAAWAGGFSWICAKRNPWPIR